MLNPKWILNPSCSSVEFMLNQHKFLPFLFFTVFSFLKFLSLHYLLKHLLSFSLLKLLLMLHKERIGTSFNRVEWVVLVHREERRWKSWVLRLKAQLSIKYVLSVFYRKYLIDAWSEVRISILPWALISLISRRIL